MRCTTRQLVTSVEKGAVVGAVGVVLLGAAVVLIALAVGSVDLGVVKAEWAATGREFALDLDISAVLWAVPVLGAAIGAAWALRRTAA